MGHCISVYLINKSELRNQKIDTIIDDVNDNKIVWTELGANILATPHIPNFKKWRVDKTVAKITTDYFGGMGEQSAKLFVNNEKVFDGDDTHGPINKVLKRLGVVRESGLDEFDTVGLGKYRSNYDFQ